jgi:hypothetical protein
MKTQRAANEPSFEWSRDLLVGAPDPTTRSSWVAAPCLPHSSAISELMKRAKSVISRPSFRPLTAFTGERDRPGLIAAVAPVGRCVPATRASPSGLSPADRQVTTHRHDRRRNPCSPIAARSQTRLPTGTAKRFAEIQLCGAWHRAPAEGRTLLLQPPPRTAIGRRERALSSTLMPGCPARGRRSQTSTGPTLLRSQPNTRLPADAIRVR